MQKYVLFLSFFENKFGGSNLMYYLCANKMQKVTERQENK
jgi:hypothetical protein